MYLIYINKLGDDKKTEIHSPYIDSLNIVKGSIKQKLYGIDEFEFTVNAHNPAYNVIEPLKTIVTVVDAVTKKELFIGRVLKPKYAMGNTGDLSKTYECESLLGFLYDAAQRYREVRNTSVADFFKLLIDQYNKIAPAEKKFLVGVCNVTNSTDNVYRFIGYEDTYSTIKDKLLDRVGGYLRFRFDEKSRLVLDYLKDDVKKGSFDLMLAKNLKSITKEIDVTEAASRIVPLGAMEEGAEGDDRPSKPRLTIASVNGGKDYLEDPELIKQFGLIEKSVMWDDVHEPKILLSKGEGYLQSQQSSINSFTLTALNLSKIGYSYEDFEIGLYYRVVNPLLGIDEYVQLIERTIDVNKPELSSLTFNKKQQSLSEYQAATNQASKNINQLTTIVQNQNGTIINTSESLEELRKKLDAFDLTGIEQDLKDKPSRFEIYTQTQVNELLKKFASLKDLENYVKKEDTGWLAFSNNTLFARCKNGVVEIDGYLNMGAGATGTNLNISLPKNIPLPTRTRYIRVDAINNKERSCMLILRTNGIININNGNTAPASDNYSFIDSYTQGGI